MLDRRPDVQALLLEPRQRGRVDLRQCLRGRIPVRDAAVYYLKVSPVQPGMRPAGKSQQRPVGPRRYGLAVGDILRKRPVTGILPGQIVEAIAQLWSQRLDHEARGKLRQGGGSILGA